MGIAVKGRILGIDYGGRRVGLALSDPLGITAQGLQTLTIKKPEDFLDALTGLVKSYRIEKMVIGLPTNMNGTLGKTAQEVIALGKKIEERFGVPVVTWDERLTSVAAHRAMAEMGYKLKGRKEQLDRIAAALILQGYLDSEWPCHEGSPRED